MTFYKVNRLRVQKEFNLPSKAKQAFADECDINKIMSRFEKSGLIEHIKENAGRYADAGDIDDYHAAMNLIADTNSMFETLPATIRAQFDNDAGSFLDFVADPENRQNLVEMGLKPSEVRPEARDDNGGDIPPTENIASPEASEGA